MDSPLNIRFSRDCKICYDLRAFWILLTFFAILCCCRFWFTRILLYFPLSLLLLCPSQAWHFNFSRKFDGLDHESHIFSEFLSSRLIIITTWLTWVTVTTWTAQYSPVKSNRAQYIPGQPSAHQYSPVKPSKALSAVSPCHPCQSCHTCRPNFLFRNRIAYFVLFVHIFVLLFCFFGMGSLSYPLDCFVYLSTDGTKH